MEIKGLNREVALIIAAVFLYFTALGGIGSVISRFSRELGAATFETGLIFSLGPMIGVLTRLPTGVLADRYGSKYFMMLGGLAVTVSALYASTVSSPGEVYLVRALQGLSMGLFISASIAAVSIYGYIEYLRQLLSYRAAVISLSALIGPLIATSFVDLYGYAAAFYLLAVFGVSSIVASALLPDKKLYRGRGSAPRILEVIRNGVVATLLILPLVNGGVFFALNSLLQDHVYTLGQPSITIGKALFVAGLTGLVSRLYAVKLIDRIGSVATLSLGVLLEAVGMTILVPWSGDLVQLLISMGLFGWGIGLTVPSGQYILLSNVAEDTRNTATAFYATGFDIGGTAGVIGFSYIAGELGFNASYVAMAIILFTASTALYILLRMACRARATTSS